MRPFLPFATLLGTAFLLGCQEQASGPVGPYGPQFGGPHAEHPDKGEDGNEATFTATFPSGVISLPGDDIFLFGGPNLQTFTGDASDPNEPAVPATLDLSFFKAAPSGQEYTDTQGAACFGDGEFTAAFSIIVKKNDIVNAEANFAAFTAKGKNGIIDVKYGLFLVGVNNGSDWPPAGTNTITWERFEMIHQGGPGRNVGCFGTGSLSSVMEVTNTTP